VSTDQTERRQQTRSVNGVAATPAEKLRAAAADAQEVPPPAAAPQATTPFTAAKDERSTAPNAPRDAPSDARAERSALAGATGSTADPSSQVQQKEALAPRAPANSALARSVIQDAAKLRPAIEVVSPDANVRWRISGANVEYSGDAGTMWQTQSTGVSAVLASGAAPSRTVCWIVGAAGTVVRSVDGRTWQRVAFPYAIDLRAVRASDEAHAVVTAVDGRTFATVDGGRTWQANGPR
jgi:hypothetical protein